MVKKNKNVLGVYKNHLEMQNAIDILKNNFLVSDLSVYVPEQAKKSSSANRRKSRSSSRTKDIINGFFLESEQRTLLPLGFGGGVGTSTSLRSSNVRQIGALNRSKPRVSDILLGPGVSDYDVNRYKGFTKNGGIILSIKADNLKQVTKAIACLKSTGAKNISATEEFIEDSEPALNAINDRRNSNLHI